MSEKIRTCLVCGKQYKYCPHCSAYNSNEKWRFVYCSDDCRMTDAICGWYLAGNISEKEAQEKLSAYTVPSNIISNQVTSAITAIKVLNTSNKEKTHIEEVTTESVSDVEDLSINDGVIEELDVEKHENKSKKKKIVNEVIE